jgi:hypothetical protein
MVQLSRTFSFPGRPDTVLALGTDLQSTPKLLAFFEDGRHNNSRALIGHNEELK